jgi:predicted molibdopterin-dependent oxidoreductase YjgC
MVAMNLIGRTTEKVVMEPITFLINGIPVAASPGQTVLEAALANGVYIPHLCFHPDLKPNAADTQVKIPHLPVAARENNLDEVEANLTDQAGIHEGERCHKCDTQCRLCLVEIDGLGVTTSCNTPVEQDMAVKTDTAQIEDFRRTCLAAILDNHIGDCLQCYKNTDCKLQTAALYMGGFDAAYELSRHTEPTYEVDDSNPFYNYDPNKCILCGNCVYTCEEIQGVGAIDFAFREYESAGLKVSDSRCESCGECVSRCPVGALVPKTFQKPSREVLTVCSYCGVGCGIYLGVRGDRIVSARANRESPVNKGNLCVKGRFGWEFVNHPERLNKPLVKKDGKFEEVEWDEALDLAAEKFSQYKGDAFGAFSSARASNEDNYVFQKFARAVMGTNNVDHCARL